jgi:alkylhydroperoxidase family enzyme
MQQDLTEDMYAHVAKYREREEYSEREKLAIEYAEKFAIDHLSIDGHFFDRLKACYSDKEIVELSVSIATFLGFGRMIKVLDLSVSNALRL